MRFWPLAIAGLCWASALYAGGRKDDVLFIIGGDTHGYLSPCGCFKPMSGGIRRRASAIRNLSLGKRAVILENGGFAGGVSRQDQLKAEALAESLATLNVSAVNLTLSEAKLGPGLVLQIAQHLQGKLASSSLQPSAALEIPEYVQKGPFLIGGASVRASSIARALSERAVSVEEAVRGLIQTADASGSIPTLMLEGGLSDARKLAASFPSLALIVYSSSGTPPQEIERVGKTALVTPGDKGIYVVTLERSGEIWTNYSRTKLEPEFNNDPAVSKTYNSYLTRVREESLLDKLPRIAGAKFSGTAKCGTCHSKALNIWKRSQHASAFKTLETENHGADPDCVGCHVVGLDLTTGFKSRNLTPQLANVGCESCHGPGAAHSANPYKVKMRKVGAASCAKCHVIDHSPGFDFKKAWAKIAHK